MSGSTKRANLSQDFMRAAVTDPLGALATQFMAAFGVDLATLMILADRIISTNNESVFMMCVAASVQIRANVVFVGRDFGQIRDKFPELVIEGDRPQNDIYNYGALHALGHIFCHITTHEWGQKVMAKVGSCITGENTPDNEAGKINREMSQSWTPTDRTAFSAWLSANRGGPVVNGWFEGIAARKASFGGGTSAAPAAPARPSTRPSGSATSASAT